MTAAFRCLPLRARLTRVSCAAKHAEAQLYRRQPPDAADRLRTTTCLDCPVGRAHAEGVEATAWPDGTLVEVVELEAVASQPVSAVEVEAPAAAPGSRRFFYAPGEWPAGEVDVAAAKKHRFKGEELTVRELAETIEAREAGLTRDAIRMRLVKGWSVTAAVATPAGEPRPKKQRASAQRSRRSGGTRKSAPLHEDVREQLGSVEPADLLARLGWSVEDLGAHPRGRLLLVLAS